MRFHRVVPDSVQGTISLHLSSVTWEQALDAVSCSMGWSRVFTAIRGSVKAAVR
jgi:type II secretory pathway component HofQ